MDGARDSFRLSQRTDPTGNFVTGVAMGLLAGSTLSPGFSLVAGVGPRSKQLGEVSKSRSMRVMWYLMTTLNRLNCIIPI